MLLNFFFIFAVMKNAKVKVTGGIEKFIELQGDRIYISRSSRPEVLLEKGVLKI